MLAGASGRGPDIRLSERKLICKDEDGYQRKDRASDANRGLGRAFAEALFEAGAARVYAGARDPSTVIDTRVTPIQIDVTSSRDIAAAAATCTDIEILINNAGAMERTAAGEASNEERASHRQGSAIIERVHRVTAKRAE